jgi:hypothetical protein
MGEETEQINLVIPKSMKEYLDSHREINRSEEFRHRITQKYLSPKRPRVHPLITFVGTIGPFFGILLILIGITPTPMEKMMRALLPLLGGILAVGTAITLYLERKRVRQEVSEIA